MRRGTRRRRKRNKKNRKSRKEKEEERREGGGGRSSMDMVCTREWAWGYDMGGEVSIRQEGNAMIMKNRLTTTH